MKKNAVAALVIAGLCVCSVLTACGKDTKKTEPDATASAEKQTIADTTAAPVDTTAEAKKELADATIKGSDAIELIKSYSDEELGLDNKDNYSFLVNNSAFSIEGEDYVEVLASVKKENADGTFKIDMKASYYIRFDGKKVLRLDGTDYTDITK